MPGLNVGPVVGEDREVGAEEIDRPLIAAHQFRRSTDRNRCPTGGPITAPAHDEQVVDGARRAGLKRDCHYGGVVSEFGHGVADEQVAQEQRAVAVFEDRTATTR